MNVWYRGAARSSAHRPPRDLYLVLKGANDSFVAADGTGVAARDVLRVGAVDQGRQVVAARRRQPEQLVGGSVPASGVDGPTVADVRPGTQYLPPAVRFTRHQERSRELVSGPLRRARWASAELARRVGELRTLRRPAYKLWFMLRPAARKRPARPEHVWHSRKGPAQGRCG